MRLIGLLIPNGHEPGHLDNRPRPKLVAMQTEHAAMHAKATMHGRDWITAEHCSTNFMPDPKPHETSPALTSSKWAGHWIGFRGRRTIATEAARLQGYHAEMIKRLPSDVNSFFVLGTTVSVLIVEMLSIAAATTQGYRIEGPWIEGSRQKSFIGDTERDRPTTELKQIHRRQHMHATSNNTAKPTDASSIMRFRKIVGSGGDNPRNNSAASCWTTRAC